MGARLGSCVFWAASRGATVAEAPLNIWELYYCLFGRHSYPKPSRELDVHGTM